MTEALADTSAFDQLSPAAADVLLRSSCASETWIAALVAGRPYRSLESLVARSHEVLAELEWPDVEEALAAHPRIGERVGGTDREAAWSRQEQAGAAAAGADVAAALRDGNVAYEKRFGHVFLICASGLSSEQMLAALQSRLANEPAAERDTVRDELAKIVRLRLARTLR